MADHESPWVVGGPDVSRAVRGLLDDFPMDQVVADAITEVRELAPEFEAVDTDRLRKDMAGALGLAVAAIRDGSGRTVAEVTGLRAIGALRAEQGIDMDSMLNGFRVVARTSIDAVLVMARDRGIASDVTLALTRAVWAHCDHAAVQLAAGHRAFSEDPSRPLLRRGEAALRTLVRGETSAERRAEAWAELGVSPSRKYRVVALSALTGPPTTLSADVERRLLGSYADTDGGRVIGLVDALPKEPWACRVGYGDASPPTDLRHSYQGAVQALRMAEAFGLDRPQHPEDVRLLRPVHEMPALGDEFVERCFGHLDPSRRAAVVGTLRTWFATAGSVDAAAEALYVHRNTLRYRLRTFADATGLSLDRPEDSFLVWWAVRRLDALAL